MHEFHNMYMINRLVRTIAAAVVIIGDKSG